jgi:hypothetical protein
VSQKPVTTLATDQFQRLNYAKKSQRENFNDTFIANGQLTALF